MPAMEFDRQTDAEEPRATSRILVLVVHNATQNITADTIFRVTARFGKVLRIVVGDTVVDMDDLRCTAMVEFRDVTSADIARRALNGANIYDDCCTLETKFAPTSILALEVETNCWNQWDYTKFLLTSPSPDGDPNSVSLKRAADSIEDSAPKKIRPEAEATFADSAATDDSWRWSSAESEGSYMEQQLSGSHDSGYEAQDYGFENFQFHTADQPSTSMRSDGPAPARMRNKYRKLSASDPNSVGCVCLVYNFPPFMDPGKVFNLFSVYGDVIRVKFLMHIPGSALVQMSDPEAAWRVINNLNGLNIRGHEIEIQMSNQLAVFSGAAACRRLLPNGAPVFWDYENCVLHRFASGGFSSNQTIAPSRIIYFTNMSRDINTWQDLSSILAQNGCPLPVAFQFLPASMVHPITHSGHLEFASLSDSLETMLRLNNATIYRPGIDSFGHILRLEFAVEQTVY